MDITRSLLDQVIQLAELAGEAILQVYASDDGFTTEHKADSSPVTEADRAAHRILVPALQALDANIPVLSEESSLPDFAVRSTWSRYWIIDPLDGTKEFIKRNGEFTVNIALIDQHVPVLGVVHVPVLGVAYAGARGLGAFRLDEDAEQPISTRAVSTDQLTVVASRSHGSDSVEQCLARLSRRFAKIERQSMGSSLKLCLVAEGKADLYPRLAPTSEWDTAAAQAVVEAAGGLVLDDSLAPLRYNTKADILNPSFYVIGDPAYDWPALLKT